MPERILIVGAGAVGSFFGSVLAASREVALIGRPERIGPPGERTLTLTYRDGRTIPAHVLVSSSVDGLPSGWRPAGVLLTVKAFAVGPALAGLADWLERWDRPYLALFQNGVGSEERAAEVTCSNRLLSGTVTSAVSLRADGTVTQHSGGGVALAPLGADGGDCRSLATAIAAGGVLCRCLSDYRAMKWSKLVLNQFLNGICALTDMTPQQVVAHHGLFSLEVDCARETLAVMDALRIPVVDLPGYPVRLAARLFRLVPVPILQKTIGKKIAGSRGDKLPSLLADFREKRTLTEVEAMYGAVADAGTAAGVCVRVTAGITALLRRGRTLTPEALLAAVRR